MVWMQQNREALTAAFAQNAPAWSVLATYLGERGITDGDGKPPTARTAREAWGRVKARATATPSRTEAAITPVTASAADRGNMDGGTSDKPRRFRPVKLRGVQDDGENGATSPAPKRSDSVPQNPEPGVDVDDLLSRFMPGATPRD